MQPPGKNDEGIIQLLKLGKTPKEIKKMIAGVRGPRISELARKLNLPFFREGLEPSKDMANLSIRVAGMFGQGMTAAQIGGKLGISRQAAHARLKRLVAKAKKK
jgi:DNA-binding CsgD family transcriptional regulator